MTLVFQNKDYQPPSKVEEAWGIYFLWLHEVAADRRNPSPDFDEYSKSQLERIKEISKDMTDQEKIEFRNRLLRPFKI